MNSAQFISLALVGTAGNAYAWGNDGEGELGNGPPILSSGVPVPVSMPAIDLTLTDSAGQLVARRALLPADFRVTDPTVAPGGEAALQVLLSAGNPRVSGYTVEVFYP